QYTRRTRIAQSSVLPPVANEPTSPLRDDSQCEACPTDSGFEADQDRANIAKTSTLPSDSTPRVTSLAADKGGMQHKIDELTALCSILLRQQSEMVAKIEAQELEINNLKARIRMLEDKDRGVAEQSGDDAPIKRRRQYTRRTRIAQSSVLPPVANEPTSPLRDDSQCEACPTDSGFEADQDRANIAKTSTLPSDSTPRVTSLAADKGAQELEINNLKARIRLLEDKDRGVAEQSGDDAPIKRRRLDKGEEASERVMVPTAAEVAIATVSIPTGSGVVSTATPINPTTGPIFTTATEFTSYTKRKGKEKMIARDAEVARIHAEEELQMMINSLDMSNETVVKYL
nr:hypothetical protein [Tanacetum cinerariifolium]